MQLTARGMTDSPVERRVVVRADVQSCCLPVEAGLRRPVGRCSCQLFLRRCYTSCVPTLETDRLLIRPFEGRDLDELAAIVADPEVRRFLGAPQDRAEAWGVIAHLLGHEALRGWSQNAVIERSTGRLVGRCGLYQPEGWPGVEVGWIFARGAWGRGFATEAAVVWRDWAFDVLMLDELISIIHPDNVASIRVAERIGHRYLRDEMVLGESRVIYGQRRR